MIKVPLWFDGEVEFQNYETIANRIKKFETHKEIGYDESGKYPMYQISVGTPGKPAILLTSTMHGTEWQATYYYMDFMEMLRDNTFPDKDFRNELISNFHIISIPVINPWGVENLDGPYSRVKGRYTSTNADLNRDFYEFKEQETKNVKKVMDKYDIFAYLDSHMIRGHKRDVYLILGNGQKQTDYIKDEWALSLKAFAGQDVDKWPAYEDMQMGLSRRYMRDKSNPYTPHTLSYITEMARPTNEVAGFNAPLTDKQIYKFGMANVYLFLKTSLNYFYEFNKKVEGINDTHMIVKDLEGKEYMLQATSENEGEVNGNQSLTATILPTKVNRAFINDISEMWNVIDHDGVEHKIIYAKRRGVGNYKHSIPEREMKESYYLSPDQTVDDKHTLPSEKGQAFMTVDIKAIPLFFDVLDNDRIYERYDEHMPAQRAFNRIFEDTGFVFVLGGNFSAVEWEGFGDGETKLETFKRALNRYKCEFHIVGKTVYLETQIGRDTQFMYRHRLNASNIEQEIDANEMWTYAKGYGNYEDGEDEGWETAKLVREYTSPLADIIGIRHAPPIKDGRVTDKKTMDNALKELVDESLKISLTADIHDLRKQGYPLAQSQLGDRVFLIDERIGLDEEIRVIAQSIKRDWKGNILDLNITFGSEGLSKRHQSNISTAVKDISDILEGRKQLPYSVLDDAVKNATKALQDAQTELKFSKNGILAIDKNDPNLVTLFNSAGVGVSDDGGATFGQALTGRGLNADYVYTGSMLADFIAGGELSSLNGDTYFDLNNGDLKMSNANFELGNGAHIQLTSRNNRIQYSILQDGSTRYSGLGVGRSVDPHDYPMTYLGTSALSGNLDSTNEYWTGLIVHSHRAETEGYRSSITSRNFLMRDKLNYSRSLFFDLTGNNPSIIPSNTGTYNYNLGGEGNPFARGYINHIYNSTGDFNILYAYSGSKLAYRFELTAREGHNPSFYGQYSDLYYDLGRSTHRWTKLYLSTQPDVSSDERLKTDIVDNDLGLNFINGVKTKRFCVYNGNENEMQIGVIAQQLLEVANEQNIEKLPFVREGDDGYYGVQYNQLIAPIIKSVQELSEKVTTLEAQINE